MTHIYGKSDRLVQGVLAAAMVVLAIISLYPMWYVFCMSISNPIKIAKEPLYLFPKGFSLAAYKLTVENGRIWRSYYNTVFYTLVGTTINVIITSMLAYPLSRSDFSARRVLMMLVTFTMLFSGGLIPIFILVTKLGLYGTRWAMILPTAVAAWNTIIARTFFAGLPESLSESARIDGANDAVILYRIILPISRPIIAVLTIFYAVAHWNSFFPAMLYLPDPDLHPLQMFLVRLLLQNDPSLQQDMDQGVDFLFVQEQLKYSAIIVAVLPIILVYPFLQKHFVKGVMIGAIKG